MINFNFQTTTGLYVGARNVYICQVKGGLFGLRLVKFGRTEIESPSGENAAAKDKATAQAIKRVFRENNIITKRVVTALPGKDVLVRHFQMPRLPRPDWPTAIKFEAKKYIPFKLEELQWDFHVVLPKGKDSRMEVTFVAVKKEVAQNYLSLLEETGLKILALEPAPFCLLRLFVLSNQLAKDRPTAIVDVDYGLADINIVKDRVSYLTRDASLPQEEEVFFDSLLNEIRMSLDYYEKLFPTQVVGKILLSGEMKLKDCESKLAQDLRVPVEVANLSKVLRSKNTLLPLNMAVVLGLALRGLAPAIAEVNLYRIYKDMTKPPLTKGIFAFTPELRRAARRALILSCLGLFIFHFSVNKQVVQEKQKLKLVLSSRPKTALPVDSLSYAKLEQLKKELDKGLTSLNLLIDKRIFLTPKLNELPKIIPKGVWLTELAFNEDSPRENQVVRSLSIKGVAYHPDPVQEIAIVTGFVSILKENELFAQGFRKIELETLNAATLEELLVKNFTISCSN